MLDCLNWEDSRRGVVYLSDEEEVAESYAESSDSVPEDYLDNIVVLRIDVSKLDLLNLKADENVRNDDNSTYEYHGVIPSSAIINLDQFLSDKKKRKSRYRF